MSLERVPTEHVEHLVRKYVVDEKRRAELLALAGRSVQDRVNVLRALDEGRPPVTPGLEDAYGTYATSSMYLWAIRALEGESATALVATANKRLGTTLIEGAGYPTPRPGSDDPGTRISGVTLQRGARELSVAVEITTARSRSRYGSPVICPSWSEVEITFRLDGSQAVAEVGGGGTNGLNALRHALRELFGLGSASPESIKVGHSIERVKFTSAHARMVASRLKMKWHGLVGDDPRGRQGTVSVAGRRDGDRYAPLDLSDDLVKGAERTENDELSYVLDQPHDDGLVEHSLVEFKMDGEHPHLRFKQRTSRLAIRRVVDEVIGKEAV